MLSKGLILPRSISGLVLYFLRVLLGLLYKGDVLYSQIYYLVFTQCIFSFLELSISFCSQLHSVLFIHLPAFCKTQNNHPYPCK